MKYISLILYLYICCVQAAPDIPPISAQGARLAMGFYYPSLSRVSSRTDIEISLHYWMKELTNKMNLTNSYPVLFDDITAMSQAFNAEKLDMVIVPPLLLAIHFNRDLLSDGFYGVNQLNKRDQLAIIARKNVTSSPIKYLGKKLLLPKNDLLAKLFIESETLKQYRRLNEQVFSHIDYMSRTKRIILALFFGKADVAVVTESALDLMTELNPQIAKKIIIIKKLPIKSKSYGYFHRNYQLQDELKKVAHLFTQQPRGKQILEVFQTSKIEASKVEDLKVFDHFYQTYQKLRINQIND